MGFDIKFPIGLMFAILGLLLTGYGFATSGSEIYAIHSLGININLWWGLAILVFSAVMLLLSWRSSKAKTN
ncbi:MAG: hypothetical protein IPG76_02690 [Acidobacteria bacterium]|nr:hypothetical protein [Acidobacteriota bacterium]